MGISADEVNKLATLSRLDLHPDEVEKLRGEIDSILSYIDAVQKVEIPKGISGSPHLDIQNVMREDAGAHESGEFTDALVAQFPQSEKGFLKVQKILQ